MTINIAFKSPDALVFATDGLASLFDLDTGGHESFLSNMSEVEKLIILEEPPVIAMFNGVGSLGPATIAAELRHIAAHLGATQPRLSTRAWADGVASSLWQRARAECRVLPTPLHVIIGGFDGGATGARPRPRRGASARPSPPESPVLYEIKWSEDMHLGGDAPRAQAVLASERAGVVEHLYGSYYAGAASAVARFVEGFDPELQRNLAVALAGPPDGARPGIVEELIKLTRATAPAAPPLDRATVQELVLRFTRRILRSAFPTPPPLKLAEHFSLQAAIDYTVFLAQCAYARENLSPTRRGPPRVGSTLQLAYLERGAPPRQLARIQLDVRLQGNVHPVRPERA